MKDKQIFINEFLVHSLISTQFPQWKNFPIIPVIPGGWDNKTFRLGSDMSVSYTHLTLPTSDLV